MRVGAIDCGTNSIRLLVADVEEHGPSGPVLTDVERRMRIVRLGAGVDATGWLSQDALDRAFAAAEEYAGLLRKHDVEHVRMVATSATRDAGNRQSFVQGMVDRLGTEPEVISGAEEARLSYAGAVAALPVAGTGRNLVVDIGGGSTEFVLGDDTGIIGSHSNNIGSVRLTERYLSSNPPTRQQIQHLVADVDAAVAATLESVPIGTATRLIGVAGSVTTVTAQALGLTSYDPEAIHGAELDTERILVAAKELTAMTRSERAALGFMHEGRADVIGAGAQIWARVVERVHELTQGRVESALTSENDILDGIALSVPGRTA